MSKKLDNPECDSNGSAKVQQKEVSRFQASPEEQAWFARTFSSDLVIMPVAPRQKPSMTPKKRDQSEALPNTKRDEEA